MNSNTKMKIVIFALSSIIVAITLLYVNNKYVDDELFKTIINLIATSIITSALFTIIINIFSRNYFEEAYHNLITGQLPFMSRISQKGLIEFEEIFPLKKNIYELDFRESEIVTIVMNDGKKFFSNNVTLFRSRFSQKNKTTNIIILNPKSGDSISVLTRKNGHENDNGGAYYKIKINNFIKELFSAKKRIYIP